MAATADTEAGMVKKTNRAVKSGKPPKGDRWTVRGVPVKLQKAAGDAARARGLTLGQWLSEVLTATLPGGGARLLSPAAREGAERWDEAIERRLARLEAAVFGEDAAKPEMASAATAAARPSEPAATAAA